MLMHTCKIKPLLRNFVCRVHDPPCLESVPECSARTRHNSLRKARRTTPTSADRSSLSFRSSVRLAVPDSMLIRSPTRFQPSLWARRTESQLSSLLRLPRVPRASQQGTCKGRYGRSSV
jgi:hypothetical protein